ncbi:hypothetical protein [Methylocystis sp. S23]
MQQIEEAERIAADRERQTALAQPHRRGERSELAESAIGRFVLKYKIRTECYAAALRYCEKKRKWLAAVGAPLPDRLGGSGGDIEFRKVREWAETILEWETAMRDAGGSSGLLSVVWMALHGYDLPPGASVSATKGALMALSVACGMLDERALGRIDRRGE